MQRGLAVVAVLFAAAIASANPIQDENRQTGTGQWALGNRAANREIEGYASSPSVNVGESIRFYVSTADPKYTLEIFRMGWYGGTGGRRLTNAVERDGRLQETPSPDPATGLIECHWTDPYEITIPADWTSGFFLVKLTAQPSREQNYIIFVVRDDNRASDLLFQSSVTTSEAYNNWGGKSLYPFNSTGPQAVKVSFDRPYSESTGPGEFLARWEYPMVRFLEREGYDVTYTTNIETHTRGDLPLRHRGFLSVGHDEYWSWQMRQNVEQARDAGVNLGFFSGNVCYWQIRFESDSAGVPNRTIVAYKESALSADPIAHDGDPTNDYLTTTQWRLVPVNRPEEQFVGVMTSITQVDGDIVIENSGHWVFARTGLRDGDRLPRLAGYEVDKMFGNSPPGTVRLAHSLVTREDGRSDYTDMTIYEAASGAIVFAAGTIQWSWGLDNFNSVARGARENAAAQQITRNVLYRMIGGVPPQSTAKRRAARH